jgi:hypothetical protein
MVMAVLLWRRQEQGWGKNAGSPEVQSALSFPESLGLGTPGKPKNKNHL